MESKAPGQFTKSPFLQRLLNSSANSKTIVWTLLLLYCNVCQREDIQRVAAARKMFLPLSHSNVPAVETWCQLHQRAPCSRSRSPPPPQSQTSGIWAPRRSLSPPRSPTDSRRPRGSYCPQTGHVRTGPWFWLQPSGDLHTLHRKAELDILQAEASVDKLQVQLLRSVARLWFYSYLDTKQSYTLLWVIIILRQGGELWPKPNPWWITYKNFCEVWHASKWPKINDALLATTVFFFQHDKLSTAITASIFTCSMGSLKAFLLHWVIREEANEQLVATRRDGWGLLGATEATQTWSFSISPVVKLNVVISTLQVGLHVDLIEGLRQKKMMSIFL